MALEGAPEVEGPEDEAPAANLGAVKGLGTLALVDLLADLVVVDLAVADLAGGCCDLVGGYCDLVGGCCDLAGGVASFLDLAGALQT